MNDKLVSIIMPYYNASKFVEDAVNAIMNQTYKDWELVIIDDCSTETGTDELLEKIQNKDERILVIKNTKNEGAGFSRNVGIMKSHGRFISFCDSDDWWYPTKLEEQLKFMIDNGFAFTCTYYEDANIKLEPYYTMKQSPKQNFKDLKSGCNIGTPGVIYDVSRIGKKYMPTLRHAEDWGLWMTILKEVDYVYTYPKALWKYRHVAGSESSKRWKQMTSVVDIYKIVLHYNIIKAWMVALFVFLPKNIIKKIRKLF